LLLLELTLERMFEQLKNALEGKKEM